MRHIKHICIADTTYTLSLYLLYMSMEEISKTLFILGDTINSEIKSKLPNMVSIPTKKNNWKTALKYKLTKYLRWPEFLWSDLYAQDHIPYSDVLIGQNKYIFVEDSPGTFSQLDGVSFLKPFTPEKGDTIKRRIKYYLHHSSLYGKTFGTNSQCIKRIITNKADVQTHYVQGKEYELISLMDLWKDSSNEKKEYILDVFSVTKEALQATEQADLLILSQPFVEDCGLSVQEMVDIYKPYMEKYKYVIIKIHPRDHFDYKKYFPSVEILKNNAPMQLFNATGVVCPAALTVCSTALSAMPNETERIYLGTKVNEKIFNVYGDLCN